MAEYSQMQNNEIRKIAILYDLELLNYEIIDGGASNTSYLLQTSRGEHVLTVFEIDPVQVENIGRLLLLLEEYEFPTTRLVTLANGKMVTSFQGKAVLLKTYADGEIVEDLDETMLEQTGMALARLHKIPAPDGFLDKHAYGMYTFPSLIGKNIGNRSGGSIVNLSIRQ